MRLGRLCGISTAETLIREVEGRDVCLIRRFDREVTNNQTYRRCFLSARSVFYADPAYAAVSTPSYARLSRWMPRYGDSGAGTIAKLVSVAEAFTLNRDEALAIIHEIQRTALEHWQDVFYEAGFGEEDLRAVAHVFQALPEGH